MSAVMYVAMYSYRFGFVCSYIVVCDPRCVQGACVANDTCNCTEGYTGQRCTEPGTSYYI